MAIDYVGLQETPEELEIRRRQKTAGRIRVLGVVCLLSIGARFLIKDPEPPKTPNRTQREVRYIPGMLEDLPSQAISKMDPKLLAQIRLAEAKYRGEINLKESRSYSRMPYQPAAAPVVDADQEEELRQIKFIYQKRKISQLKFIKKMEAQDLTKGTLIRFKSGGFLKVENAVPVRSGFKLLMGRTIVATMPKPLVSGIQENAAKWEAPIPKGFVRLRPANGISITLHRETAKRVTIRPMLAYESES